MKIDLSPILEKFNQLDNKARYAIFAGLLFVIFLLDLFTIIGLQWSFLQKVDGDNQTLQQNIERTKSQEQGMDHTKKALENSRSQLEAMKMKIRSVQDKDTLLENISRVAKKAGVKIDQLSAQTESQQPLISAGAVKYYALPIVIQATSGYHNFGYFLNQLESENLFFNLSNVVIESRVGDVHHQGINATLKVVLSDINTDVQKK